MSKNEAKSFIEELRNDSEMNQISGSLSSADEVLAFANKNGYSFSKEELQRECDTIELTDDAIDKVAGGKKTFFASKDQVGGFLEF